MTTIDLYRKHKAGEISREKFLYEVRRDNNLPFITNLTSYDDAVKILKNRGIVTEGQTKEAKADEAVKAEVKPKKVTEKKSKELHVDQANPYEYRHGIQHELCELDDYSNEALEKAKDKVLKNLAKDANYYSNLLNQKQSPYEFKQSETDAKGNQARPDGGLKKELKKNEKSNVKDTLGKKEAGKKKPKGVKTMPDKGVTGSEKTIKEGLEDEEYMRPRPDGPLLSPEDKEAEDFELLKMRVNGWYKKNFANPKSPLASKSEAEFREKVEAAKNKEELKQVVNSILMGDTSSTISSLGLNEKEDKLSKVKEALKTALKTELSSPDAEIKNTEIKLADLYQQRADNLKKQ